MNLFALPDSTIQEVLFVFSFTRPADEMVPAAYRVDFAPPLAVYSSYLAFLPSATGAAAARQMVMIWAVRRRRALLKLGSLPPSLPPSASSDTFF